MKTSNVLASVLFSSLTAAIPFDKRALVTKTEVVVETVVVYTTVYDGDAPSTVVAATPTSEGLFYEHSKPADTPVAKATSAAYTPPAPAPAVSSSVYTPPPAPSSVYTPPAPSSVYTPPAAPSAPASSVAAPSPAPVQSSAPAPAQSSAVSSGGGNGQKYHGDITIYDNGGGDGACGKPIVDGDKYVALAAPTWGKSTYDVMTGQATNPWCGKKITISYNGKTVDATIMDLCPGCAGSDIDLTYSLWQELTGTAEKTRFQADWWVS